MPEASPNQATWQASESITPNGLGLARSNLRHATTRPLLHSPTPGELNNARGNLNHRAFPQPIVRPTPAALNTARANLNHREMPQPIVRATPAALNAARHGLRRTETRENEIRVVPLADQKSNKFLNEIIILPLNVYVGKIVFRIEGRVILGSSKLIPGVHLVEYAYKDGVGVRGPSKFEELHIKPDLDKLMRNMGFVRHGGRWQLDLGAKIVQGKSYGMHLTVYRSEQSLPDKMDKHGDIFSGIFPSSDDLSGVHVSIECRQSEKMNNAAYFMSGETKSAQGFTSAENDHFISACKKALHLWQGGASATLKAALATS
jgi:hypothetical protein